MKFTGLLALALLVIPSVAAAQNAPPMQPPMQQPNGAGPSGDMQQSRAQMMHLRQETRVQMLDALTPQHRSLLASVIGRLATSSTPDAQAAAQQLDSALSPQESQAILAADASMRSQIRAAMQSGAGDQPPQRNTRTPDAGAALLHAALAIGAPMRPQGL